MNFLALCLMVFAAECIVGGMGRMVLPFGAKRQTDCAPEQLQQCMAPLNDLAIRFSGSKLEDLSDPLVLDRTCTLMSDSQTCLSNYVNNCYPAAASDFAIQTIQAIVSYICSPEGRDVLLTDSKCLTNPEFEKYIEHCHDQMATSMEWAYFQPDADSDSVCGLIDDFSECVGDKVKAKCSEKAATFVKGLVSRVITPYRNRLGCDIEIRMARDLFKLIDASRRK